jgi:hypothetical protein
VGGGSEDFVLLSEVRRVFLRCEEEHENDMKAFLGNRLFAKAQRIGVERFASHEHSKGVEEQQERAPTSRQKRGLSSSGGGGKGSSLDSSLGQTQGLSTSSSGRLGSSAGASQDKSKASSGPSAKAQGDRGGPAGGASNSGVK